MTKLFMFFPGSAGRSPIYKKRIVNNNKLRFCNIETKITKKNICLCWWRQLDLEHFFVAIESFN